MTLMIFYTTWIREHIGLILHLGDSAHFSINMSFMKDILIYKSIKAERTSC